MQPRPTAVLGLPVHPRSFQRLGTILLVSAFALSNVLVLLLVTLDPLYAVALPGLIVIMVVACWLFTRPTLNLFVLLAGFAFIARFEEGFQVIELVYAMYLAAYLGFWFINRQFREPDGLLTQPEDRLLAVFLIWMTGSFALTILFNGNLKGALSEWSALLMLALYFPIKEACAKDERAPTLILIVVLWLAAYAAFRNLAYMREALLSATQFWQVVRGRIPLNEILLLSGSLASLVMLVHSRDWRRVGLWLAATLVFAGSLVITQSRAYWIDFGFGVVLLALVVGRAERKRVAMYLFSSALALFVLGLAFFGDFMWTLAIGLIDRFMSIFSAASSDISLINRFFESRAVWDRVLQNPIMGYGLGVQYRVFDIIDDFTFFRAYTHNGILSLWYKFGIVGLLSMLFFWFRSARAGLRAFQTQSLRTSYRLYGLIACLGLATYLPSVMTSNPFFLSDTLIIFGIMAGWAGGVWSRAADSAQQSREGA